MTSRTVAFLGLFAFCLLHGAFSRAANVVISEIYYHPPGTNILEEFIELQNVASESVDLSDWKFTKGVRFAIPSGTQLLPGTFLVIAADTNAFAATRPGIGPVLGGWQGTLDDDGEEVVLEDSMGAIVASVAYAPNGDWARRQLGENDAFRVKGWEWIARHAGDGASLELRNPILPGHLGHNWASSTVDGGTPGQTNSASTTNVAPLLLDVAHFPPIPKSSDSVVVQARAIDETLDGVGLTLHVKADGDAGFDSIPMWDDGKHRDGVKGDGLFAAVLPARTQGTVVEFFIAAQDGQGNERIYPDVVPSGSNRTANMVYQVDDEVFAGNQPLYRLILPRAERDYLQTIWDTAPRSDATVVGTFIALDGILEGGTSVQVRYNCGFRNRGNGTRTSVPHNLRVNFPKDRRWEGRASIVLNTQYTLSQSLGSILMRRANLPMPESRPVRVRVNGLDLANQGSPQFGFYVANELVDDRFLSRQFPDDDGGDLYQCMRDVFPGRPAANLAWHGELYTGYTNAYFKRNHGDRNQWQGLIGMIDALNNSTEASYVEAVQRVLDVEHWVRYFAINTLLDNQESSLGTGYGDDYVLYQGIKDPRFKVLPYDTDSMMGQGVRTESFGDGLFRVFGADDHLMPVVERFIKHPQIAPRYYAAMVDLADREFQPAIMNVLLDSLKLSFGNSPAVEAALANMKAFNASHLSYVRSRIPRGLSLSPAPAIQSGYYFSSSNNIKLGGKADAVRTRSVWVNGIQAVWTAWRAEWNVDSVPLNPGINRVRIVSRDETGENFEQKDVDVWYDDGSVSSVGGAVSGEVTWTAAGGPYLASSTLTIADGATLRLEAGTTVYFGSKAKLVVASGGRLIAEGTVDAPIRFSRPPDSSSSWSGVVVEGTTNSPETVLKHVHIVGNGSTAIQVAGGTVLLEDLSFGTTEYTYLALDAASFIVRGCHFPSSTVPFELVHGTEGIKPGGHGIFSECFFGTTTGYNDIVDFTGGERASQPVIHFVNNVFVGASDDILDLDSTDAWVEGNIFLHTHKNGSPDSASAVSGGNEKAQPSRITIVGNLFFDCDHAATAKEQNFYVLLHNTIVRQTRAGGLDTEGAVVNFADEGKKEGAGMYLEGNLIYDAEQLVRFLQEAQVTFTNNLMPFRWTGAGGGNSTADPLLIHVPALADTQFRNWREAQILWRWFSTHPASPARRFGANQQPIGAVSRRGVSLSGVPAGSTSSRFATITVGNNRKGSGIDPSGWPEGAGFTQYRWRLDGGNWSAEQALSTPIELSALADGTHVLEVSGKMDTGLYQDDPRLGPLASPTSSAVWTVDPAFVPPALVRIQIHEILASNRSTYTSGETTPDLVEIHNPQGVPVDIGGLSLTDDLSKPRRFVFAPNTLIPGGGYLLLLGDSVTNVPGIHIGFGMNADGDSLYLMDAESNGGAVLDSVKFGLQVTDASIGRRSDGSWGLCVPTPGAANVAASVGAVDSLRINELLASGRFAFADDFVELINTDSKIVELGGVRISDAPGDPDRHVFPALSFIAGRSCLAMNADGNVEKGGNHLGFKLSAETGTLHLRGAEGELVDMASYGPQTTDISMGRSPNGNGGMVFFRVPTPGAFNLEIKPATVQVEYTIRPLLGLGATWRYDDRAVDLGTTWREMDYDDAGWKSGAAPFGLEPTAAETYPVAIKTPLNLSAPDGTRVKTYYFRTHFEVEDVSDGWTLYATNFLDDGAVFYLNGKRVGSLRVADDPATYGSDAVNQPDEGQIEVLTLPATSLVPGDNVLAVEVHQAGSSSSDVFFAMGLTAIVASTNTIPPDTTTVALSEIFVRSPRGPLQPGWVELRNTSTNAISISGVSLSNDPRVPLKWICPEGVEIPGGGFHLIRFDSSTAASSTNAGFRLRVEGDSLYLFEKPSRGGGQLDGVGFGPQAVGYSVGRLDSELAWSLCVPTPLGGNQVAGMGFATALRLNEWMADPVSGADWLEIYNSDAAPVAIEGLSLTDDFSNRTKSPFGPLSFIGVGINGYLQVFADKQPGGDHASFRLSKSGSPLGLFAPSGQEIDVLIFEAQLSGVSEGRLPDGASVIQGFPASASPGSRNVVAGEVIDTDGDSMPDAWEIASGLDPLLADGAGDLDQDGMSNLEEFLAGTNPIDFASVLKLSASLEGEDVVVLQFQGVQGRRYSIEIRESFSAGTEWRFLTETPALATSGTATLPILRDSAGGRFFRMRVLPSP